MSDVQNVLRLPDAGGKENVACIGPEPDLTVAHGMNQLRPMVQEQRNNEEEHEQEAVIEREDPQHSPGVEGPKIAGPSFGVVENAGDEISREHEEKIDPAPS